MVGTHVDNGSVTIAGTAQSVDSTSFTTITGTVAAGTLPGRLRWCDDPRWPRLGGCVGGIAPGHCSVEPAPILIGLPATVTGAHFGKPQPHPDGQALTLTSASDSELKFVVPASVAVGPTQLLVTGPWGQDQRTVNVQCVSPTVTDGPVSWILGATVELTGTGLSGATVSIGGEAQAVTLSSDAALTFVISAGTPTGGQDLVVTNGCGTFNQSVNVAAGMPVITSTNPTPAVRFAPLNIIGDFLSGASVTIGGIDQTVTLSSKQGVTLAVAATTPLGEQTLTVTTLGGQASTSVMVASPIVVGVAPIRSTRVARSLSLGQHLLGATVTSVASSNPSMLRRWFHHAHRVVEHAGWRAVGGGHDRYGQHHHLGGGGGAACDRPVFRPRVNRSADHHRRSEPQGAAVTLAGCRRLRVR